MNSMLNFLLRLQEDIWKSLLNKAAYTWQVKNILGSEVRFRRYGFRRYGFRRYGYLSDFRGVGIIFLATQTALPCTMETQILFWVLYPLIISLILFLCMGVGWVGRCISDVWCLASDTPWSRWYFKHSYTRIPFTIQVHVVWWIISFNFHFSWPCDRAMEWTFAQLQFI